MSLTNKQREALNVFSSRQKELYPGRDILNQNESPILLGDELTEQEYFTTSNITLSVSSSGSDSNINRLTLITGGDYSSLPFSTVQGALDSLPKIIKHKVIINVDSGTTSGFLLSGFSGSGIIDIIGTNSLAAPTTGVNSGTAGSGTTSTAVKKPTGSDDWTADNLIGKLLIITGGAGFYANTAENILINGGPCQRVITDNTTDTLSIDTLTGIDNTTTFQIVENGTFTSECSTAYGSSTFSIGAIANSARILIRNVKPTTSNLYGFFGKTNGNIEIYNCTIPATGFSGAGIYDTTNLVFKNNYITGGSQSYIELLGGIRLSCDQNFENDSRIEISNFTYVSGNINAINCTGNASKVMKSHYVNLNFEVNDSTATPVVLQSLQQYNGIISGTNSSTTYGVTISGGGQYVVTGSDIVGSSAANALVMEGTAVDWTTVALGTYAARGTFVYWGSGATRYSEEIIGLNGVTSGGIFKAFGQNLDLGDASAIGITAFAAGGQGSAATCGWQFTSVNTAASPGASVILRAYAAGGGGCVVANLGANAITIFPAVGGTINGGSTNAAVTVSSGSWAIVKTTTDGTTYRLKTI